MENDRVPAAVDARPDADYIEQTIPTDPDTTAVDSVDAEAVSGALDSTWSAPEEDLIEQSIPIPLDDDR